MNHEVRDTGQALRRSSEQALWCSFSRLRSGRAEQAGQILIESIVGISIALMGLLGVLTLLTRSFSIVNDTGEKLTATYLAAEGVEVVKNLIDQNYADDRRWDDGISDGSFYVDFETDFTPAHPLVGTGGNVEPLMKDPASGLYRSDVSGTGVNGTPFRRWVEIAKRDLDDDAGTTEEIVVRANIRWSLRGGEQNVVLEDHFFNWR